MSDVAILATGVMTSGATVASAIIATRKKPEQRDRAGVGIGVPGTSGRHMVIVSKPTADDPEDWVESLLPPLLSAKGEPITSKAFWIGLIMLFAWVLPLLGLPLALIGIGIGLRDLSRQDHLRTKLGIYLCLIGVMVATANTIGAYIGAKGGL